MSEPTAFSTKEDSRFTPVPLLPTTPGMGMMAGHAPQQRARLGCVVTGKNVQSDGGKALNALRVAEDGDIFSHKSHAAFPL